MWPYGHRWRTRNETGNAGGAVGAGEAVPPRSWADVGQLGAAMHSAGADLDNGELASVVEASCDAAEEAVDGEDGLE